MSEDPGLSRRRFVAATIAAAALPLLSGVPRLPGVSPAGPIVAGNGRVQLAALLQSRASAVIVGEAYLAAYPEERAADLLTDLLTAGWDSGASPLHTLDADRVRELVAAQVKRDFSRAQTVEIDGWMLSRTEARLCALTALT
jgi:hypothetical protein